MMKPAAPASQGPSTPAATAPNPVVEVTAADLQDSGSVCCPNPKMALWSGHPKVFIKLGASGEGRCPYCGTVYRLTGPLPKAGH